RSVLGRANRCARSGRVNAGSRSALSEIWRTSCWWVCMSRAVSFVRPVEPRPSDLRTRGHRILVCVDRSEPADACLAYGIVLAHALNSELTLLHVLQPPAHPHHDALDW